jgi:hypothetical protein
MQSREQGRVLAGVRCVRARYVLFVEFMGVRTRVFA